MFRVPLRQHLLAAAHKVFVQEQRFQTLRPPAVIFNGMMQLQEELYLQAQQLL